ncbi:MAG: DoxX-like family protein [Myxococcales bacterium]|nr:DoxX-like family protein [Myxococcales bacterium]
MNALAEPGRRPRREGLALRGAVAFVWLATGLGVLHPAYRAIGSEWLGRLGLPDALMFATCAAEILLGLAVLGSRPNRALLGLQAGAVLTFTIVLASLEPLLLAHPFGVLSKNLPFLLALAASYRLETRGADLRYERLLVWGAGIVWITEGIFPKLLFQQPLELAIVESSGLVPFDPSTFLFLLGSAQALSGVLVIALRGRAQRLLLGAQALALILLPTLVALQLPELWFHPFGPLTKNVPPLVCALLLLLRPPCSSRS